MAPLPGSNTIKLGNHPFDRRNPPNEFWTPLNGIVSMGAVGEGGSGRHRK